MKGYGQNFVQAGGNTGGSMNVAAQIAARYFDRKSRVAERDYYRNKDLDSRKELITHQTNEKIRGSLMEGMMSPHIMGNVFDYAHQTYGEDHPDVVSGKRKSTDYLRPELQHLISNYGVVSTKNGILPGTPGKGKSYYDALQEYKDKYGKEDRNVPTKPTVNTSSIIASSPVGGQAPKETDIESALYQHNTPITFGFDSSVGESGRFSPTSFNEDQTPVYSEFNAEESRKQAAETPSVSERKIQAESRSANLSTGKEEGRGGNK